MKQNARPATAAEITEIVGPLDDAVLVRTARDSSPRAQSRVCAAGNAEEMEDHGAVYETRTLKMREQIEAMKEISTKDEPEYHGEIVDFPPMMTWLKPVQTPHPPIIVGGTIQELSSHPTRRWRETDFELPVPRLRNWRNSRRAGTFQLHGRRLVRAAIRRRQFT